MDDTKRNLHDAIIMIKPDLSNNNFDLKKHLESIEVNLIQVALEASNCVITYAARTLGIRRTTLIEKMKKYNISKNIQPEENSCNELEKGAK